MGLPSIDVAKAREAIAEALAPLARKISPEFLEGPVTPASLRDRLIGGGFHVLHLLAHGILPAGGKGPAHLVLEKPDESGEGSVAEPVDEGLLAEIFEGDPNLRLVMLLACHGGALSTGDPFSGLALQMVNRGLPAVVAMRQAVSLPTAKSFSQHFYANLARTGSVERAVNEARQQLYLLQKEDDEWATPVLFQRLENDLLWEPEPQPVAVAQRARSSRKSAVLVAAMALLLVGLGIWLFVNRPRSVPRIAVLSFTNASPRPEPGDAWISTALGDIWMAALRAGEGAQIVNREEVSEAERDFRLLRRKPSPADFRRRLGVDYVVSGSFERADPTLERFTLSWTLAERGTQKTEETDFSLTNLVSPVAELASTVLNSKGLGPLSEAHKKEIQALFPENPIGRKLFFAGLASIRSLDSPTAYEHLVEAARHEEHPLIYARLASAAWDLPKKGTEARSHARRARELAGNLPRREQLLIQLIEPQMSPDWKKVASGFEQLHKLAPQEYFYWFELADAQASDGNQEGALATLDALLEKRPAPPLHVQAKALYKKANIQDDRGLPTLDLIDLAMEDAKKVGAEYLLAEVKLLRSRILSRLGKHALAEKDLDAAQDTFRQAGDEAYVRACDEQRAILQFYRGSPPLPKIMDNLRQLEETYRDEEADRELVRVLVLEGMVLTEQGKFAEAEVRLKEAESMAGKENRDSLVSILVEQAYTLVLSGKTEAAAKMTDRALEEIDTESSSKMAVARTTLAEILYYRGRLEQAKKYLRLALKDHRGSLEAYDRFRLGMILAAQGDADGQTKVEEAYKLQEQMGEGAYRAETALGLARLHNLEGDFRQAADLAEHAEKVLEPAGRSDLVALAQATRAWALTCEGDEVMARKALAAARQSSRRSNDVRVQFETRIGQSHRRRRKTEPQALRARRSTGARRNQACSVDGWKKRAGRSSFKAEFQTNSEARCKSAKRWADLPWPARIPP
jgi:tetratricopeptide (TPR) repeat protein